MFTPIRSLADIPERRAFEHLFLELKGHPDAYRAKGKGSDWNTFEMAKDVAAFGNTRGGTIVIGAVQEKRKFVLERLQPGG